MTTAIAPSRAGTTPQRRSHDTAARPSRAPAPPPAGAPARADLADLATAITDLATRTIAAARTDALRREHGMASGADRVRRGAHGAASSGPADAGATRADSGAEHAVAAIAALLRATDRLIAAVVVWLLGRSQRGIIADTGLTSDAWLRAVADRTGADAGMLTIAAERLADMPATLTAFCDGAVSWGSVRGVVLATRPLTGGQRRWLDDQLARDSRLTRLDGDQLAGAAEHLVAQCRTDLADARAERAHRNQYVRLQPALDGSGGQVFARLDAETFAAFTTALDTVQAPDAEDTAAAEAGGHGDTAADAHDDADEGREGRRSRRERSNVAALRLLSEQRLTRAGRCPHHGHESDEPAGDPRSAAEHGASQATGCCGGGAPSTARPSMLVVVDLAALTGDGRHVSDPVRGVAQLLARTGRPATIVSPDAARRLACDATMRLVLTHGAEPVAVTDPDAKVSSALRAALTVRDGGCRFPACHASAETCDAHHLVHRADGGPTTLQNLALLCGAHHHAVHEGGWSPTLHADGSMTFTRRGVAITSVPRAAWHRTPEESPPRGQPRRRRRPHPVNNTAADPTSRTSGDSRTAPNSGDRGSPDHDPPQDQFAVDAPDVVSALPF